MYALALFGCDKNASTEQSAMFSIKLAAAAGVGLRKSAGSRHGFSAQQHMKLCASCAFWLLAYPTQTHEMFFDAHLFFKTAA